jgi:1A family penicillin-binding protein
MGVLGAIAFFSYFIYLERTLPDPEVIASRKITESTKIYDKTGQVLLYDIHGEEKRTVIPWDQIPQTVKDATLASEDSDFYIHKGLDLKGIIRAFLKNLSEMRIDQGGSTITQQLIKKALLTDERTYTRKIKELLLSIEIERRFTKDQIFWMYLNQIPYGSNAYGIQAASKTFFGKNSSELTLAESATLAAMIKATTYYSPYGNHVPELIARRNNILNRMKALNMISEEEHIKAIAEVSNFKVYSESIIAPHFVIMVKDYLSKKYGEDAVLNNGYTIITTLDADLQKIAEETVTKYSKINKEKYKAGNSALVAIDPKTGEVLSLVGSHDYFNVNNEGNFNVATANRQPGSSFKPFAYATAFEKGYPDNTILFDFRTEFNPNCPPDGFGVKDQYGLDCYNPQNYDERFRGPVTMRQSLAQSLNIPSVKTLYLAGIPDTIALATKMGITTLNEPSRYGLSLVLGGAEVKLIDLVSAYGVFANDGIRVPWAIIKKIEASDGSTLEELKQESERVISSQTARQINNVLSDNSSRAPVFGYSSSLYIPGYDVAAKTGTTQENRDAWVVGYSPTIAVGVWNGNNKNQSMTQAGAGISASGPMWNAFIIKALPKFNNEKFQRPDPVNANKIMLDGNYININSDGTSSVHSILYYVDINNPLDFFPSDPNIDPQFKNWEWPVQNFFHPIQFNPTPLPNY